MPKPSKNDRIACRYHVWILSRRNGVWRADGRSNPADAGRHSLGTRDRAEARRLLDRLDATIAARRGVPGAQAPEPAAPAGLPLEEGRRLYLAHVGRAKLLGGARASSQKRYRAVFDKFVPFARDRRRLTTWEQVTATTLADYLAHLQSEDYAPRTQYLEGTTLKQAVAWLVAAKHLSGECLISLPLGKPRGTDTHCWTEREVRAILAHCRASAGLAWLAGVLEALTYTGLRISELISLRWSDINFATGMVTLADESSSRKIRSGRAARTLKGGRGRSFPLHGELRPALEAMPRHPDGYVFHGPEGGRLKADTARRALIRDVLTPLEPQFPAPEGEVGFIDGRLHSFRHFFCSLCAGRGVPQQVVMRWLGHRDSKMVEHYFHLNDDEARRQMRRVGLSGGAGGE